jgi:M6 family metalloprotease-like protein
VQSGVSLGFPRDSARQKATGDVRYRVLFVDFPDAPATRTPQDIFAMVSPGSEAYFQAQSAGRMTLTYQTDFRWLRMSRSASSYVFNTFVGHRDYIQEAVNLAGASVDYSQTDGLLVLADPATTGLWPSGPALVANAGSGVTAGGKVINNAVTSGRDLANWGALWANHELLHNLSLPDLYAPSNPGHRYVGMFSIMGLISGPAREMMAWERWNLGWLDDTQVWCVTGSGSTEVPLTPVSQAGGLKMVVVPVSGSLAVVVESRRLGGYDAGYTPGALVYLVDLAAASQQGPIRVVPINEADSSKGSAPLGVGRSVTTNGVTISVVTAGSTGDTVRIVK